MGLFQKNICPKCGQEYSALRGACPNCGARKLKPSSRTPASSDTVRNGSAAQAQRAEASRWQFVVGLCLVAAVIIAVIVLIVTTINGDYSTYPTPTPSEEITSPTPPPSPSPSPTPTPTVESVAATIWGNVTEGFTINPGDTVQLEAQVYPVEVVDGVTWESTKENVCTVSSDGLVTGISSGSGSIIVRCYGKASEIPVIVR